MNSLEDELFRLELVAAVKKDQHQQAVNEKKAAMGDRGKSSNTEEAKRALDEMDANLLKELSRIAADRENLKQAIFVVKNTSEKRSPAEEEDLRKTQDDTAKKKMAIIQQQTDYEKKKGDLFDEREHELNQAKKMEERIRELEKRIAHMSRFTDRPEAIAKMDKKWDPALFPLTFRLERTVTLEYENETLEACLDTLAAIAGETMDVYDFSPAAKQVLNKPIRLIRKEIRIKEALEAACKEAGLEATFDIEAEKIRIK